MIGNLHAAALLSLTLVTIVVCARCRRERPRRRMLPGLLTGALLGMVASCVSSHLCRAGQPLTQWLIPAACLAATLTYVGHAAARWTVAIIAVVAMFGLSSHYSDVVHGPVYIGNPHYARRRDAGLARDEQWAIELIVDLGDTDDEDYPSGWLSEASFVAGNPKHFEMLIATGKRIRVRRLWHSWLTRLYERQTTPLDMWFGGGKLKDAASNVEYRERMGKPPSDP